MTLATDFHTAEMVLAMPDDGKRYEVVWGQLFELPTPTWRHQIIAGRILVALGKYCERTKVGEPLMSPADISWSADILVQPDVFVVAPEHEAHEWADIRHLRLVVEVLLPSTAQRDRFQKRKLYQQNGVETIWLVDPERQLVEEWTPEQVLPVVETERVVWRPEGTSEELRIDLARLFES